MYVCSIQKTSMIKLTNLFISCTAILSFTAATAQKNIQPVSISQIDEYIAQVQKTSLIPGVSLAIIKNGKIIHRKNYGYANLENDIPVSDKTIFRLYSLTKPIVATGVFQLIEKGKLSLEDPVSTYIPDLPASWNTIQIKNLLTQSSGLPDIVKYEKLDEKEATEKVFADPINFKQGEKFEYNQTNFWLLERVVETVTKRDIETYIAENQFDGSASKSTVFFSTDSRDIVQNRATPYFNYATGSLQMALPYNGNYLNSCNGLNITMNQFIAWDAKFRNKTIISDASKAKMWEVFPYTKEKSQFTSGWDQRIINGHISYGFSGGRITAYRIFPKDDLSIIFLANGLGGIFNVENTINQIAYLLDNDIIDYKVAAYETLLKTAKGDITNLKSTFTKLKNDPKYKEVNFEESLNVIGYIVLNQDKKSNEAITVFQLNAEQHPKSFNAFDSLAEAYEINKDFEKAISNYTQARELNNDEGYRTHINAKLKELSAAQTSLKK